MAVKTLRLSTAQVVGLTTTQVAGLTAVQVSASLATADLATAGQAIIDDRQVISPFNGPNAATIQPAIIFTATSTKFTNTLASFALVSPSGATIAAIQPGYNVLGPGLTPATTVVSATGTTITLSANAVSSKTAAVYACTGPNLSGGLTNGALLNVPNRGQLIVFPGDVVAWDNLGFPYLIPAASVNFNGGGVNSGAPFLLI